VSAIGVDKGRSVSEGRPLGLAAALSDVRSLLRLLLGVQFTPPVNELDALVRGSGTSLSSRVAERPVQG
jgi:hypothetical protein